MKKSITSALAIVSLAAGFAAFQYIQETKPATEKNKTTEVKKLKKISVLNQKRADFSLPDLEDKIRHIKEWDGKVILLNFWATWCPPCRREIPAFIELQDTFGKDGFQVVGVAIDEKEAVIDYADGLGVNYPIMIGNNTALKISADYGNRFGQLPYSLIIDRKGIIRFIGKRELSYQDIEKRIKPLL
ncbi:MAG: TlpA family protein disulfide reductase [Gammaproteobacteria bacterium]|nr:TlpA family protein disulfide reductase [Gammaproteobacteria bacterium]